MGAVTAGDAVIAFLETPQQKARGAAPSPDQKSHAQCTLSAGLLSNTLFDVTSWSTFFNPQAQLFQNLTTVSTHFDPKYPPL